METEKRRNELYNLLGELPPRSQSISAEKLGEETFTHYIVERWLLDLNGTESVPAYFTRPLNKKGLLPVVVFNHSHGGNYELGKDELIQGNTYLQMPSYAEELAKMGYAAFSIDAWGFGERNTRTESELFKEMLWRGEVLWGKMVYDTLRAVDYLSTLSYIDSNRIATMGISMGSVMSWWTAALEPRIKVCVDICGLVDFHSLINNRATGEHGIYFFVPSLLKHFTTSEINALIAPRPHLSLAGNNDKLVPANGLDSINKQLKAVYLEHGKPEAWKLLRYPVGHVETAVMRQEIKAFLKKWL